MIYDILKILLAPEGAINLCCMQLLNSVSYHEDRFSQLLEIIMQPKFELFVKGSQIPDHLYIDVRL